MPLLIICTRSNFKSSFCCVWATVIACLQPPLKNFAKVLSDEIRAVPHFAIEAMIIIRYTNR